MNDSMSDKDSLELNGKFTSNKQLMPQEKSLQKLKALRNTLKKKSFQC